jgi:hypothetical protein
LKPCTSRGFVGHRGPRGKAARSKVAAGTAKRRGVGREPKATETSGLERGARAGISPTNSKPLVLAFRSKGFQEMSNERREPPSQSRRTVNRLASQ